MIPSRTVKFVVVVIHCSVVAVAAQPQIGRVKGRVLDAQTGVPLPGANVFIANTTLGDASREDGWFEIQGAPEGLVEIVASMVGYEPSSESRIVENGRVQHIDFKLNERTFVEGEALVVAKRPRNWRRNLDRFTRELLGTSKNADGCRIVNPHVLDFIADRATGTLRAFASEPLVIENRALGYDLIFVLDDFEVSDSPYSIRYRGNPRFKEREHGSANDYEEVAARRRSAYLGSLRHFLVSMMTSSLAENGFLVYTAPALVASEDGIELLPRLKTDSLVTRGQSVYERFLYAPGVLHVTYSPEPESGRYRRFVREVTGHSPTRKAKQVSYLSFDHGVTVHTTGYLYEPYAVTTRGYWAWERLADTLPRDYRPD